MKLPPTLAEVWAERYQVSPDRVHRALFWQALPPGGWPFALVLGGPRGPFFAAEREFISAVAALRRLDGFADAYQDFVDHPANRGFLRRRRHCRVSSRRLWRLAQAVLPADAPLLTPFRPEPRRAAS